MVGTYPCPSLVWYPRYFQTADLSLLGGGHTIGKLSLQSCWQIYDFRMAEKMLAPLVAYLTNLGIKIGLYVIRLDTFSNHSWEVIPDYPDKGNWSIYLIWTWIVFDCDQRQMSSHPTHFSLAPAHVHYTLHSSFAFSALHYSAGMMNLLVLAKTSIIHQNCFIPFKYHWISLFCFGLLVRQNKQFEDSSGKNEQQDILLLVYDFTANITDQDHSIARLSNSAEHNDCSDQQQSGSVVFCPVPKIN